MEMLTAKETDIGEIARSNKMTKTILESLEENGFEIYESDCRRCGECCSRFLPMDKTDIEYFMKLLKRLMVDKGLRINKNMNSCPMFDWSERSCMVYESPFKPQICESFECSLLKYPSPMMRRLMFDMKCINEDNDAKIVDTYDLYEIVLEDLERKGWTT